MSKPALTFRRNWIRTNDILLPKQALYQAELHAANSICQISMLLPALSGTHWQLTCPGTGATRFSIKPTKNNGVSALRFLVDPPGVEPAHPQHRFCLPIGCSGFPPSVYTHLISELSAYCVGLRQALAFTSPSLFSSTRRTRTGRLPKEHPTTSFGFYYKGRQRRNIAMPLPFRTEPIFASGRFATLPLAIRSGAKIKSFVDRVFTCIARGVLSSLPGCLHYTAAAGVLSTPDINRCSFRRPLRAR